MRLLTRPRGDMGCGVSKFEAHGTVGDLGSEHGLFCRIPTRTSAVADISVLSKEHLDPEEKVMNIIDKDQAPHKNYQDEREENHAKEDDSIALPRSPSFREYCVFSVNSDKDMKPGCDDATKCESQDNPEPLSCKVTLDSQAGKRGKRVRGFRSHVLAATKLLNRVARSDGRARKPRVR